MWANRTTATVDLQQYSTSTKPDRVCSTAGVFLEACVVYYLGGNGYPLLHITWCCGCRYGCKREEGPTKDKCVELHSDTHPG